MSSENFPETIYYVYRHITGPLYMASPKKTLQIVNLLAKSQYQRLMAQAGHIQKLKQQFKQALRPALSPHCELLSIHERVLTISVDSSVWASRLRYEQQRILSKLQANPEFPEIASLSVKIAKPKRIKPVAKKRQANRPSEDSIATMSELAQKVDDPKLKKALQRLAQRASKKPRR
jgi:hypothetical protein